MRYNQQDKTPLGFDADHIDDDLSAAEKVSIR